MSSKPTSSSAVVVVGETILSPTTAYSVFKAQNNTDRYLRGYNTHARDAAGWEVRGGGIASGSSGAAAGPSSSSNPFATADIVASVSGLTELTESIVSVSSMSPRYHPEVGDVVVGRIIDVVTNRWRCEVFGLQDAIMLIRNVTGPGSILRRKGREDELTMRTIFKEDDVFVAEVQRINLNDGTVSLHIRSAGKYGKRNGIGSLVLVRPALVPRMKQQFYVIVDKGPVGLFSLPTGNHQPNGDDDAAAGVVATEASATVGSSSSAISSENAGVQVVFGANGGIWVGVATARQVRERKHELFLEATGATSELNGATSDAVSKEKNKAVNAEKDGNKADTNEDENPEDDEDASFNATDDAVIANNHRMVAIVSNCIRLLNTRRCMITPSAIEACLSLVFENNWSAFDIVKGGLFGPVADAIIGAITSVSGGRADMDGNAFGVTQRLASKRQRD